MKTEVKKIDDTQRELIVELTGERIKSKFEDVFQKVTKEAKVPGFRPGHAPRDLIEKHYSAHVHEQVVQELVPDIYNEAIDKEGLDVIELPEISDVKLDTDKLVFKAKVEVRPEIKLKEYKGIKLKYKKITVTPDEVKRNIDSIKESRKIDSIDDKFAKGLGYPNLGELERAIDRQIFLQKENQERSKLESEVINAITKEIEFKIPASLVNRQAEELTRQAKLDLALKGVAREKIDEEVKKVHGEIESEAKKQMKIYLILAEIAKKEKIALDEHMQRKVLELLLQEANWQEEGG
jgi:FKBP-type peptidyl-prolyl cis-trans isomerase (trigger factor)